MLFLLALTFISYQLGSRTPDLTSVEVITFLAVNRA